MSSPSNQVRRYRGFVERRGGRARGARRCALLAPAVLAVAVGLAGCGETVSTGAFTGAHRQVAKRISEFQKHVTESSQTNVCKKDLSIGLQQRIAASKMPAGAKPAAGSSTERSAALAKTCEETLKEELKEVESLTIRIEAVDGKERLADMTLVKERNAWFISGL
jgi:hypothetical protein